MAHRWFYKTLFPWNARERFVNINAEKMLSHSKSTIADYFSPNFSLLLCHNLSLIHVPSLLLIDLIAIFKLTHLLHLFTFILKGNLISPP